MRDQSTVRMYSYIQFHLNFPRRAVTLGQCSVLLGQLLWPAISLPLYCVISCHEAVRHGLDNPLVKTVTTQKAALLENCLHAAAAAWIPLYMQRRLKGSEGREGKGRVT
eukprot:1155066-Pelagomonas_calceolata.AAC.4